MKTRDDITIDIYGDMEQTARKLITATIQKDLSDIDINLIDTDEFPTVQDYISYVADFISDLWIKHYIRLRRTKEAINKIKAAQPPKEIKIYLEFNIEDDYNILITDEKEIESEYHIFRAYLPTGDLWDTYIYACSDNVCKFESLEVIEPAYIEEIKEIMSEQEKADFDKLILKTYAFHNRLLETTPRKLRLYTAQPEERINEWNKTGIIPKGSYFTDAISRAEYYYNPEENDIIVYYYIPENKVVMTSEFGGVKEYVTIEDVKI